MDGQPITRRENPADHLNLARHWALRYGADPACLDDTDEFAEACVALCNAARLFDPTRGFRFSTYASWAIKNQLNGYKVKQAGRLNRLDVDSDRIDTVYDRPASSPGALDARDLVETLGHRTGRMVWLKVVEGWSTARIASAFRAGEKTVRLLVEDGLRRLREVVA